jgi:hypothetical protein
METAPHRARRSVWVWIISIFYILSSVSGLVSWLIVISGPVAVTPQVKAYLGSLTTADFTVMIIQSVLTLSAALALLLLRKHAYYFFCASLAAALIEMLWQAIAKGWLTAVGSVRGGAAGTFLGMVILLAVCLYSRELARRGRLT